MLQTAPHLHLTIHLTSTDHNMSAAIAALARLKAANKRSASSNPPNQSPTKKSNAQEIAEKFDVRKHNLSNLTLLSFEKSYIPPSDALNNFLQTAANRQFLDLLVFIMSTTDNYKTVMAVRIDAARVTNNVDMQSNLTDGWRIIKGLARKIAPQNLMAAAKVRVSRTCALYLLTRGYVAPSLDLPTAVT